MIVLCRFDFKGLGTGSCSLNWVGFWEMGLPKMEEAIHIGIGLAIGIIIKFFKTVVSIFILMHLFRPTTLNSS
jgi:hypothetical protein